MTTWRYVAQCPALSVPVFHLELFMTQVQGLLSARLHTPADVSICGLGQKYPESLVPARSNSIAGFDLVDEDILLCRCGV